MPPADVLEKLGLQVRTPDGTTAQESLTTNNPTVEHSTEGTSKSSPRNLSKETAEALILGEGLPIVPQKLVAKILKGDYLEMSELLHDNIELSRKNPPQDTAQGGTPSKLKRRELTEDVNGLMSWVQCFSVYIAVITNKQPTRLQELLAYMVTMINEARRFKMRGWLAYDEMFRQRAAKDHSADWTKLNNTLYAVTFLSQKQSETITCKGVWGQTTPLTNVPCQTTDTIPTEPGLGALYERGPPEDGPVPDHPDNTEAGHPGETHQPVLLQYVMRGMQDDVVNETVASGTSASSVKPPTTGSENAPNGEPPHRQWEISATHEASTLCSSTDL